MVLSLMKSIHEIDVIFEGSRMLTLQRTQSIIQKPITYHCQSARDTVTNMMCFYLFFSSMNMGTFSFFESEIES